MQTFDLSVIIVNWNTCDLLRRCLAALTGTGSLRLKIEMFVIDNASTDGSAEMVACEFPYVRLIRNTANLGFARANNQGLRLSRGRYVLLLNSDALASPEALAHLVHFMDEHPDAGICGPRLVRPDGTPQVYAFGGDPTLGYLLMRGVKRLFRVYMHDWATSVIQEVDWVSGACLMARRQAVGQVGLLDEEMFMYFEDNDWCLRMRQAGWRVYHVPEVSVVHVGGQSLAKNPAAQQAYYKSLVYFYRKHYGPIARWLLRVLLIFYRNMVSA